MGMSFVLQKADSIAIVRVNVSGQSNHLSISLPTAVKRSSLLTWLFKNRAATGLQKRAEQRVALKWHQVSSLLTSYGMVTVGVIPPKENFTHFQAQQKKEKDLLYPVSEGENGLYFRLYRTGNAQQKTPACLMI